MKYLLLVWLLNGVHIQVSNLSATDCQQSLHFAKQIDVATHQIQKIECVEETNGTQD